MKRTRKTKEIRSSLKTSTIEGSWWAVMYGTVETYFGAFFEYLKFNSYEISILMTFPVFIGAIFQSLISKLYEIIKSRKLILVILKIIQSFTIPIIFFVGYISGNYYLILFLICFYFAIAVSQMSPWTSWMGYLVPSRIRGRYFGGRSQIIRVFMLISSLIAGAILNGFSEEKAITGFGIIFAAGLIANFISAFYLNKQYEPSYELVDEDSKSLNLNAKPFKKLKEFIIYDSLSEFALHISGPLMMIYWLRELNFNYIELAILLNIGQLTSLFSIKYWGIKIDQLGTYPTIRWSHLLITIFPIFWIIIYYLPSEFKLPISLIIHSLASLIFSGRYLALDNRLYEHMQGRSMIKITSKRILYKGLLIFIGGIIGGFLSKTDISDFTKANYKVSHLHLVMLTSVILRLIVWIWFLRRKESYFIKI